MNLYEVWFDTGAPFYADHTADVHAANEQEAIERLKDYRWCEYDEHINVYRVITIK